MAEPFLHGGPAAAVASVTVTVRYFAAARAAAGVAEEKLDLPLSPGSASSAEITVAMVLAQASERHGPGLARVLPRCSFLLDEVAVHGDTTAVRDGQQLDVLPPFAGG